MQISPSFRRLLHVVGWTSLALFWIFLLLICLLLTRIGGSDAAYIFVGLGYIVMSTLPALIIPTGVIIYGVRKEHALPLFQVLFKWGTIASMVYVIILSIAGVILFS